MTAKTEFDLWILKKHRYFNMYKVNLKPHWKPAYGLDIHTYC